MKNICLYLSQGIANFTQRNEISPKRIWTFVLFFIAIVTMHFSVCSYNIHQSSTLRSLKIGRNTIHLKRKIIKVILNIIKITYAVIFKKILTQRYIC